MQVSFHHPNFMLAHTHNPTTMSPKLFLPSTIATPRHRRVRNGSAAAAIIANQPESPHSVATALDDYRLLFSSQPAESKEPLLLLATEGALPDDFPLGTYYLVGPGMVADGHGSTVNPLDGHGYLRAFRFVGRGAVMYSARYVETEAAREERDDETGEWKFRRPGFFSFFESSGSSPFSNLFKNVANTSVLCWGKRLFCLWEGGHPYELEPTSLATIGLRDLTTTAEGRRRGGSGGVLNLAAGVIKTWLHG